MFGSTKTNGRTDPGLRVVRGLGVSHRTLLGYFAGFIVVLLAALGSVLGFTLGGVDERIGRIEAKVDKITDLMLSGAVHVHPASRGE